jgi:hypothetical protein
MTDVWKDWENEGTMSSGRLKPSEVIELLCAADGWKMTYHGSVFYFQFDEGGIVISDTDESILKDKVESSYHLNFKGENIVLLTIEDAGALKYLSEGIENTLVISSYTSQQIAAKGEDGGENMTLTSVTTAELAANSKAKADAIIANNKANALEFLKGNLSNGVLRTSSGQFIAHHSISYSDADGWKIKVSLIAGGVLTHTEYGMTVNTTDDEKATLSIDGGVTVNGMNLSTIYYEYTTGSLSTDNANVTVDLNKSSDMVISYTSSSWKTHKVDWDNICAGLSGIQPHSDIEFDDRSPRNIVVCPGNAGVGQWHYVFFGVEASSNDATGRVYLTSTGTTTPFGGYGSDVEKVQTVFGDFLAFFFSADGHWMYRDSDSYLYVISPTSDYWFRMKN